MSKEKDNLKEYFRHDYHARNHLKFKPLLQDFGVTGLGIYWCIVEMLYEEGGSINTSHYKSIAFDLRITEQDLKKVIEEYNLFDLRNEAFSSKKVIERLSERAKKAKAAAKSAKKKWAKFYANADKKLANAERLLSDGNAIIEENRDSIEENRREVKIESEVGPVPPALTVEQRKHEFGQSLIPFVEKYGKEMIRQFFEYWTEKGEKHRKMRFEKERVFEVEKRLVTWKLKEGQFGRPQKPNAYKPGQFVA